MVLEMLNVITIRCQQLLKRSVNELQFHDGSLVITDPAVLRSRQVGL